MPLHMKYNRHGSRLTYTYCRTGLSINIPASISPFTFAMPFRIFSKLLPCGTLIPNAYWRRCEAKGHRSSTPWAKSFCPFRACCSYDLLHLQSVPSAPSGRAASMTFCTFRACCFYDFLHLQSIPSAPSEHVAHPINQGD